MQAVELLAEKIADREAIERGEDKVRVRPAAYGTGRLRLRPRRRRS